MEHYSERLRRNFQKGDWLRASEARGVLSANAGRHISDSMLSWLVQRGELQFSYPWDYAPTRRGYLYEDLAERVIRKPGGVENPELPVTPIVRAQRAYRARKRALRDAGNQSQGDAENQS